MKGVCLLGVKQERRPECWREDANGVDSGTRPENPTGRCPHPHPPAPPPGLLRRAGKDTELLRHIGMWSQALGNKR